MAEIPVERKEKSSFPWWLIPLILLLLLLPLLYFTCGRNDGAVSNANNRNGAAINNVNSNAAVATNNGSINSGNTAVVVNSNSSTAPGNNNSMSSGNSSTGNTSAVGTAITDVNYFGSASDKAALVGREINLSGVRVERVLSDRVFTVKSGSGELFVLLDENLDSGGGKEQQIKMRPGQNVALTGDFRRVPNAETKEEQSRDLNKTEYGQMKGQQVYLHAKSVSDIK